MADQKQPMGQGGPKRPRRGIPPVPPLPKMPRGDSFWVNLATSVLLLLLLAGAYSYFAGGIEPEPEHIPISVLASDVEEGTVSSIVVKGEELEVVYNDETKKTSKKEADAALTQTLVAYGVSTEALSKVSISVEREGGVQYWLLALAPFLLPILLLIFFVWYLSRQVRGGWHAGVFLRPVEAPRHRPGRPNPARDL